MPSERKVLLLVGGGHVHIQVIKDLASSIKSKVKPIIISDFPTSVYSGMLPAVVADLCPEKDALVDLPSLCQKYGWELIIGKVTRLNPEKQQVFFQPRCGMSKIECMFKYDILSINVGSRTKPLTDEKENLLGKSRNIIKWDKPHIIKTRPISALVQALEQFESVAGYIPEDSIEKGLDVSVIGAGAAGLELMLAIHSRFKNTIGKANMTLISSGESFASQFGRSAGNTIFAELRRRNIRVNLGKEAISFSNSAVILDDGSEVRADLVVIATGAAPHEWMRNTNLTLDESGWIIVRPTLQSLNYDNVFACGDCASFDEEYGPCFPPKAGVYAVRQGPILTENLEKLVKQMTGEKNELTEFIPQRSFLSLLSLGDGRGLGAKYGLAFKGTWVFRLKSHIDESWQSNFRVFTDDVSGENVHDYSEKIVFNGSIAEAAAVLLGAEDVLNGDSFEEQLSVLRRLDNDETFRNRLLKELE